MVGAATVSAPLTAVLRTLCLSLFALLGAFAPAARADTGGCCALSDPVRTTAAGAPAATSATMVGGADRCCCGATCHCAPAQPARDCGCHGTPRLPKPDAAPPPVPMPPVAAPLAGERTARPAAPHVATASRLRAATASGLPHVLLPARSRQEALSVWRC